MGELPSILLGSLERAPWGWLLLLTVLLALIKVWPVMALQAQVAREKLRKEARDDLTDCKERLDAVNSRLDDVEAAAVDAARLATEKYHELEMKLLGSIAAYRILDVEVEAKLPGSTALGQARAVMSAAFTLSPSTPPEFGEVS